MNRDFKKYFFWRMISSIGDEVWAVSLPVLLAGILKMNEIGHVYSIGAMGTLLGFFLSSWVGTKFNETIGSLYCDMGQSIIFFILSIAIFFGVKIPLSLWVCLFFIVSFLGAVWFALSESMISQLNKSTNARLHKWNYLASTAGPIFGPIVGGIMISIGSFFLLPFINSISFFGQAFQIKKLSAKHADNFELHSKKSDWIDRLRQGVILISKDAGMRGLTAIPLVVKISLVGILPFISVKIAKSGYASWIGTSVIACFAIGSIIGGLVFDHARFKFVNFRFSTNVYAMLIAISGLTLLYAYQVPSILGFVLLLFFAGFFSSQYTIQLRFLRQKNVAPHLLSSVISGQSFLVRLATPISGFIFGQFIFNNRTLTTFIYSVLIFIAIYGVQSVKKYGSEIL